MELINFFKEAVHSNASDIFIVAGRPISYTVGGSIMTSGERLLPINTKNLIEEIYKLAERDISLFLQTGDDDFSFSISNLGRFRVNTYMQRGSMAAVLRIVVFELPNPSTIGIPDEIMSLANMTKGLILVTGPAGSGKSTSLACLVDRINKSRECHIITLEDPLEFIHKHDKSIVSQREIHMDTQSYAKGLRAALREAPNVILLGEMRDYETISIAMSAAETGQLIFSTLHTLGAANTVDRIIDVFPSSQQQQVRVQLSMVLKAVVCQQLIPSVNGKMVPVFELMLCNNAIRTMIRDSKVHQIDSTIHSSANQGMISMDNSIYNLYKNGIISLENALLHSLDQDSMKKKLGIS